MEEFSFLMPLLLAIGGLLVGALLKSLLRHSRVPYTVALFAVGLLVGLADRNGLFHAIPRLEEALVGVANINPDFILYIFLPVLISMQPTNSIFTSSRRPLPMQPCWPFPD